MRVLVADDDGDVTLVLAEALGERGHLVAVAATGQEAIDKAAAFQPDAAVIDVGLPDMDGVTLAELLRGAASSKPVRIIGLSGYSDPGLRAAVARDLFDELLFKPASLAAIERALRAARPDSGNIGPRSRRRRPASA